MRAAFAVGWVLWFAYIVAGVLYALGFAAYAALALQELWRRRRRHAPAWLGHAQLRRCCWRPRRRGLYTLGLIRKAAGGGQWATVGKLVVFVVIILAGVIALLGRPPRRQPGTALDAVLPRRHQRV